MTKDIVVTSRINEETFESLEKVAKVKKWKLSQLIREILEEYTNVA